MRTPVNVDNPIHGFGRIGGTTCHPWLALQNTYLVAADVNERTLSLSLLSATDAAGYFCATGEGRLALFARGGFSNANGTVEALSNSTVTWRDTRIISSLVSSGTLEFLAMRRRVTVQESQ